MSVQNTVHDQVAENVKKVRHELEVIDAERYKAAVIRARSERLWMGEMPNKRAMSHEKRHASRNEIKQIRFQSEVTSEALLIERAFVEHYRELFGNGTRSGLGFDSEFMSEMPRLEDGVRESLEMPISVPEIERAIDELPSGKSPGPDGLGAKFYKSFSHEFSCILHRLLS